MKKLLKKYLLKYSIIKKLRNKKIKIQEKIYEIIYNIENNTKVKLLLNPKYKKSFNEVKQNFHEIDYSKNDEFIKCLIEFYPFKDSYLDTDIGKKDFDSIMTRRLKIFRYSVVPWINSIIPIKQKKVLEIGCGTGCMSIPLAEQECELTSIDLNEAHLEILKKRCELHKLAINILAMDAVSIDNINTKFDIIIFSAVLEHLTYKERFVSLKSAWDLLKQHGLLIVIDAPNRLHYFDHHSSLLPFFHWLPEQLAVLYSKFSPRQAFADNVCNEEELARFGRGVSFHEFELALNIKINDLNIFSMQPFLKTPISNIASDEHKFINLMKKLADIPEGFYYEDMYIAIEKP